MCPKISVVIPVYNVEKYLERCLDSIVGQTLSSSELEIICVDDGSTDASPDILNRYAATHPNLHVINQKNAGSSIARNRGIEAATGDYIHFVDSDDTLSRPDALELLYERAKELELDELCFCADIEYDAEEFKSNIDSDRNIWHFHAYYPPDLVLNGQEMFLLFHKNNDYRVSPWRRLYRRAFLLEHKLRFVEGILHQDQVFARQCAAFEKRVACYDIVCYNYLKRQNSVSAIKKEKPFKSIYSRLIGSRVLYNFAANCLVNENKEFVERFLLDTKKWAKYNAKIYLKLSPKERRCFWDSVPTEKSEELKQWMREDIRALGFPAKLKIWLLKFIPEKAQIRIKSILAK